MTNPSYSQLFGRALPFILANCSVPLLGIVDTAVIGNTGSVDDLGAIALGSLIFAFIFFAFGFLRMSTTGFVSQAFGADAHDEIRAALGRALLLGGLISLALVLLQSAIVSTSLELFSAAETVEETAASYLQIRLLGAPATFASMAIFGTMIGLGKSRQLMFLQFFLSGINMVLDYLFAAVLDYGAVGIAYGTVIAEWSTVILSFALLYRGLKPHAEASEPFWPRDKIVDTGKLRAMLSANRDIMIRTVLMLFCFGVFTNSGAAISTEMLAANHILLQLITFSAFFLDGFAYVTEAEVGSALGAKNQSRFDNAIRRCSVLAVATAGVLALIVLLLGSQIVNLLANDALVVSTTLTYLPYCSLYILLSVAAFQFDGVFIGAIRGADMRNASILAVSAFLALWWLLSGGENPEGLWISFIAYVALRAVALSLFYPRLRASVSV
jgi:MATE family multidrug resistance protein